jgi:hypothetical protein
MKSTILILFLYLPVVLSGQAVSSPSGYEETNMDALNPNRMLLQTKSADAYGTMGTPYVFEEFRQGNVYYANQQRVAGITMNYDCHNNRLEYITGGSVYLLHSSQVNYAEFLSGQGSTMLFEHVFVEGLKKRVFLQVLYNDSSILYKRYFKEFREADYGGAYSQDRRYDEYHDRHSYYLKIADNELQILKPKKNSILEIMEGKSDELDKYIKKVKPDLKTEEGLIQVIRFYDNLE